MPAPAAVTLDAGLKIPLLEGLAPRDRDLVLAAAASRRFAANSVITTQGTPADRFYLLVKGSVRFFYTTSDGQKILLIWMAPGDAFGGAAVIAKPSQYLLSSEAVKDSEVLDWDRATFRGFIEKIPRILDNALCLAVDYLDWYMQAHIALTCHTARERLAQVLLGLARSIGEKVPDGIEMNVTNEELANAANITPYTTSRLMSSWRKSRAVVKRRGKILLRAPEGLLSPAA